MMKIWKIATLSLALVFGYIGTAMAQQGGVVFIPPITPGDCADWYAANILKDAGVQCNGGGTGNATFGTTSGNVANDVVTMSNTTTGVKDSGIASSLITGAAQQIGPTAFAPTDASVSGIVFTIDGTNVCNTSTHVCATSTQIGNEVIIHYNFEISSNSSTNYTEIGGLPVPIPNKNLAGASSIVEHSGTLAYPLIAYASPNTSQFDFLNEFTNANVENITLSTVYVSGVLIYPAS